ncbi:MAG: histidine phosphatase family protein [Gemmatimonadaceae bacterium]|nr:histidine phosphatase family protein [Gemmatimonadaceae bacterium]
MSRLRLFIGLMAAFQMFVAPASAQQGAGADKLVFIVRHAEKASETDPDPSLSEAGKARAAALAVALRDAAITDVLVTPRKRTLETAADVISARQLTAHVVGFGANTTAHAAAVADAVRAAKGNAVLVVGHSNTVTMIIAALGGPKLPELCDPQYAGLYIVHLPAQGAPTLVRAQYGAADPPNAATCAANSMR